MGKSTLRPIITKRELLFPNLDGGIFMAKKTTKKAAAPKKATAKKATAKKAAPAKKATAKKAAPAKKATAKKAAPAKKATVKKVAAPKKKTARKPNAAFMKPLNPSKELAEIVGASALPRTEVMKKVWAYIKKNNLQDAKNRRAINADDKLKAVFGGKKQVTMFEMTKLVSNHLK
jgi:upstream activation factor subunit UAF30